ncbi:uncharacterized protein LOC134261877 [Saccostrea cucullata]|uniref:uncharacterized protein LOC134261877 n=1 Tax=Saccostrea cuccullata TaxID=36930 RepID=UPI002ED4019B
MVLFCFLCSDSGPPDFTDEEWLDMLNGIRQRVYRKQKMYGKKNPVTSEEAQEILDRLKSRDYLWEDQDKITKDTRDETMYRIASMYRDIPFIYSSYNTASVYLRSQGYNRKPEEKCVRSDISYNTARVYLRSQRYNREPGERCVTSLFYRDDLLILRLQMNILTHVTMEDMRIYELLVRFLNIPYNEIIRTLSERTQLLITLKEQGEAVHYRGRSHDSVDHLTWLWRDRRPDIVRSCIGLHPHNDIYIIDNKAYRKPSEHHKYSEVDRSILYSLLLCDKYTSAANEMAFKSILIKVRERYFQRISPSDDVDVTSLQDDVMETQNGEVTFISDDIRHDVMYALVTECLEKDSDLEFFLTTASRDVISEYCRSWAYKRSEGERCLYIPDRPEKMCDLFINKLQLDIITHCTVSDWEIHGRISKRWKVPGEILRWDQKARERYVQYAERGGVQEVHHARGMIVGCAGAGKTTLLNRLLKRSKKEIEKLKSTKGLEVHEEKFEIREKRGRLIKGKND